MLQKTHFRERGVRRETRQPGVVFERSHFRLVCLMVVSLELTGSERMTEREEQKDDNEDIESRWGVMAV